MSEGEKLEKKNLEPDALSLKNVRLKKSHLLLLLNSGIRHGLSEQKCCFGSESEINEKRFIIHSSLTKSDGWANTIFVFSTHTYEPLKN